MTPRAAAAIALASVASAAAQTIEVAQSVVVCQRPGITGAGWALAEQVAGSTRVALIFPNHPDDWGKSGGTGLSVSNDGGLSWTAAPDNTPFPGMVDMWQDRLRSGELVTFGIRALPEREKTIADPAGAMPERAWRVGISRDQGRTWEQSDAAIHCPPEIGVVARPLPHIIEEEKGTWIMPAYSWGKPGTRALLLESSDRGRNWSVRSTITSAAAIVKSGVPVTTPWLETMVAHSSDGSLLAVMRTGSSAEAQLVCARSSDGGRTWSSVGKLFAGPQREVIAGKLPNLLLLPCGALALLTAHTQRGCFLYLSHDGKGHEWSAGQLVTKVTGGNTSMVALDANTLLVFTPANGRINSWRVTLRP